MKSYIFPVTLEPDEDVWRAYVPELEEKGAATWGHTREEALRNIQEVARMVIEVLLEDGEDHLRYILPATRSCSLECPFERSLTNGEKKL